MSIDWFEDALHENEKVGKTIGGQERAKRWSLYGENSIVEKGGGGVVVRLLPRKEVAALYEVKGKELVRIDAEVKNRSPFFSFFEHWYGPINDNVPGKRKWTVCPKSFGKDAECPICDFYLFLSSSDEPEKRAMAKQYMHRPAFAWSAIVGQWRKRRIDPSTGEIDVRMIMFNSAIHTTILETLLRSSIKRVDLTDPLRGFDIEIFSPTQRGARWNVQFGAECPMLDPQLYSPQEFVKVLRSIPDLEESVKSWVSSVDFMKKVLSQDSIANEVPF